MTNFIELNLKDSQTSLQTIDHEPHLRVLRADLNLFKDERVDMPGKFIRCIDCGITNDIVAISSVGYCKHCHEFHQYDNY